MKKETCDNKGKVKKNGTMGKGEPMPSLMKKVVRKAGKMAGSVLKKKGSGLY